MADALTGHAPDTTAAVPEYPMRRDAPCPLAPPPAVHGLRDGKPISRVRIRNGATPRLVIRHAAQRALLTDPRVSDDDLESGFPHVNALGTEIAPHTPWLITNDAPEYTRLRRTVNAPFLVKRIEALRAPVRRIVDELIDDMPAGPNPADLLTALALPVQSLVIAELLGVPYEDHEFFQRSSSIALDGGASSQGAREASGALAATSTSSSGSSWRTRARACCPRWPAGSATVR
jgi:cytochrome P450